MIRRCYLFAVTLLDEEAKDFSEFSLIRTLIPFVKTPPVHLQIPSLWGLGFNILILGRHIQTIVEGELHLVID